MSFENIIGHEKPKALIERALKNGRLSHALLFDGIEGVGKTSTALALARCLSCEGDKTVSCACRNCRRILHGNHPGISVLSPLEDKQEFTVEVVRTRVLEPLAFKTVERGWRVFIFNESEKFTDESANVLLKTLEEPPPETLIVLETRSVEAVAETLVSRCQRIRFSPVPENLVADFIQKSEGVSASVAATLAKFSGGSIGRALSVHREGFLDAKNDFLDAYLSSAAGSLYETSDELLSMVDGKTLKEQRKNLYPLLDALSLYLRDVLVRSTDSGVEIFHSDRREFAERSAPAVSLPERLLKSVEEAKRLVEENTNIKYVMLRLVRDYIEVKNAS